jgi:arginine decarboxylase-like protein
VSQSTLNHYAEIYVTQHETGKKKKQKHPGDFVSSFYAIQCHQNVIINENIGSAAKKHAVTHMQEMFESDDKQCHQSFTTLYIEVYNAMTLTLYFSCVHNRSITQSQSRDHTLELGIV